MPEGIILPRIIKRTDLGLVDAYVVNDEDLFRTYMPWTINPLTEIMVSSGFVDDKGHIHFEFNHSLFDPKKYLNFKALLRPNYFYEALVQEFLQTSLLKDERKLIAGGHFIFNFKTKENSILNIIILPRHLIPDVDPDFRKELIFRFQESFDRLTRRMGGESERAATLVIPDQRMLALGYERYYPKTWKEKWALFKDFWPITLRGTQRVYIKRIEPFRGVIAPLSCGEKTPEAPLSPCADDKTIIRS